MRASGVAAIVAVAAVAVVAAAAMGSASVPLDRPLRLPFSYGRDVTDTNVTAVCWKATVDRGVGKPISWCNTTEGLEKSGLLCYPVSATAATVRCLCERRWLRCLLGPSR